MLPDAEQGISGQFRDVRRAGPGQRGRPDPGPGVKKVDIVCILSKKGNAGRVPGTDAAQHVARHGIDANVVDLPLSENSVAATIDSYARTSGADLTVMGGFGHSRLREFILGGVTRELSATTSVPLLLAH